jgi:hypothetical protein
MSKSKLSLVATVALAIASGCALQQQDETRASQLVRADEAAVVCTPDQKAHVTIPAGALAKDTTITIDPADAPPQAAGYTIVGQGYELGPSGTQFSSPAQVELHYDESKLPAGVTPDQLGILAISDGGAKVETLSFVTVDPSQHALFGNTSHFTWFAPIVGPNVQLGGPGGTPSYGVSTSAMPLHFDIWLGPNGEVHSTSNLYASGAPTQLDIRIAGAAPSTTLMVKETLEDPGGPGTPWDAMPSLFVGLSETKTDASGTLTVVLDGHTLQNTVSTWVREAPGYPSGRVHITVYTPSPVDFWVSFAMSPTAS